MKNEGDTVYVTSAHVVATRTAGLVFLRDSSLSIDHPLGKNEMIFTVDEWRNLITVIKNNGLDVD